MMYHLKNNFSVLSLSTTVVALAVLSGCGGGGSGGGSSSPTSTPVPSPLNATYNATMTPADAIPADGRAPSGTLKLSGGKVSSQTTFFLQPSVVKAVQDAVNAGLNNAGYGYAVPENQVPQSIDFTASGQLDGSGKVVLTSKKSVSICGATTLTLDPTFTTDGTTATGTGTYTISFPNNLTISVRGQKGTVPGTCNNLPLRVGTVTFTKQ